MRRSLALSLGLHAAVAAAAVVTWPHATRPPMLDAGVIGVEVVLPGAAELQGPARMEEVAAPAAEAAPDRIADTIASLPPEEATRPDTPPEPPPPPETPAADAAPAEEPQPVPDAATLVPPDTRAPPPVQAAPVEPQQAPPPPPRPAETVRAPAPDPEPAPPAPETLTAEAVETPEPPKEPEPERAAPAKEPETARAEPVEPAPAPQTAEPVEPETATEVAAAPVPKRKPTPPPAPKQERAEAAQEKAKPRPTATSFLDRVAAAVDNARTAPPASARSAGQARAGVGAGLTDTERDRLRRQVSRCWREPVGAPRPEELVVTLSVELTRDGKVAGRPRAIEVRRDDSHYRAAIDAAVRAVQRCQPYDMPAEKYDSWRTVELVFDPADPAFR